MGPTRPPDDRARHVSCRSPGRPAGTRRLRQLSSRTRTPLKGRWKDHVRPTAEHTLHGATPSYCRTLVNDDLFVPDWSISSRPGPGSLRHRHRNPADAVSQRRRRQWGPLGLMTGLLVGIFTCRRQTPRLVLGWHRARLPAHHGRLHWDGADSVGAPDRRARGPSAAAAIPEGGIDRLAPPGDSCRPAASNRRTRWLTADRRSPRPPPGSDSHATPDARPGEARRSACSTPQAARP